MSAKLGLSLSLSHIHTHTLREEHKSRVCKNKMLRRIFGPKREEVAGGWRRLHNEDSLVVFLRLYMGLYGSQFSADITELNAFRLMKSN
jgi:hypothetical protein